MAARGSERFSQGRVKNTMDRKVTFTRADGTKVKIAAKVRAPPKTRAELMRRIKALHPELQRRAIEKWEEKHLKSKPNPKAKGK